MLLIDNMLQGEARVENTKGPGGDEFETLNASVVSLLTRDCYVAMSRR